MSIRSGLHAGLFVLVTTALAASEREGSPADPTAYTEGAGTESSVQEAAPPATTEREPSWGLNVSLGFGGAGGDFGDLLEKPVAGDFNIFRNHGKWRFGVGLSFTSFTMKDPYEDEDEWGFQQTYLFATRMLQQRRGACVPISRLRGGLARLHPAERALRLRAAARGAGRQPHDARQRFQRGRWCRASRSAQPFARPRPLRSFQLLQRLRVRPEPRPATRTPAPAPPGRRGSACGGIPTTAGRPGLRRPGAPDRAPRRLGRLAEPGLGDRRDAGHQLGRVGRQRVRAQRQLQPDQPAELVGQPRARLHLRRQRVQDQPVPPSLERSERTTTRAAPTASASGAPRSSRSGGAFFWECCGETHPMSYNDMISTGIGGMAVGEQMYRVSSQLLDNQAAGKGRVFRRWAASSSTRCGDSTASSPGGRAEVHANPGAARLARSPGALLRRPPG